MNSVILMGRLTKDPQVSYTGEGKAIARFTVAVDRNKDQSDFIGCVAFGKTAEIIEKYFAKGKPIALLGHIQTGSYEKEGKKVYTTDVIADRVEFVLSDKTEAKEDQMEFIPDDSIPF